MAIADLDTIDYKLRKRGFRREDAYYHECGACHERAVRTYVTIGRTGGRDISICEACGAATSWRSSADFEKREQDTSFDLHAFLG